MSRSTRVLILLNGDLGKGSSVRGAARECGLVACADGGARHAAKLGLKPRLVIGDMDSLPARLPRWTDTVFLCDFDADTNDFEKALRFAAERGFKEAWVAAAYGAPDYALVNFAVAERWAHKLSMRFLGEPEARLLGPGRHRVALSRGRRVTLISATERSRVETRGLAFPLKNEWLERGSRGLSNKATGATVVVKVRQGRVWLLA
ncbi:MAG: thiamine diphosphokinase [Elusimicrobia bacterium]|nr:thiamine diphosphokinase [Elusimicrobiota bacterium]